MRRGRKEIRGSVLKVMVVGVALGVVLAGCGSGALPEPVGLAAAAGDGSARLTWDAVDGAVGYRVLMHTAEGVSQTTYTEARESASSSMVWTGLANGTRYYFAVAAIGTNGIGPLSSHVDLAPFAPLSGADVESLAAESATNGGRFGISVVTDGTTLAIGASGQEVGGFQSGAVYVYRSVNNGWGTPTVLSPPSPKGAEEFGTALDMDGDYLIVGAPGWVDGFGVRRGRVFVYERTSGNTWELDDELGESFGSYAGYASSVAISGEYAAVGAEDADAAGTDSGAVYVYRRGSVDWGAGEELVANGAAAGDNFGASVDLDGNYLVAGAPGAEYSTYTSPGVAQVFRRIGTNSWAYSDELIASDGLTDESVGLENERFGDAVSIDDGVVVVGSPYDSEFSSRAGSVHVYRRTGEDRFSGGYKLLAPDATIGGWFGTSVALADGWLAVGASNAPVIGVHSAGTVYLYHDDGNGLLTFYDRLEAPAPQVDAGFGFAVGFGGGVLVVGAPWASASASNDGQAFVYR